jgi:protein-S-isoprenylcysteine O-methyltransferase Ste14
LKEDHELIRSGPYAKVRHPIYSGVLLGAAGTALVQGKWRDILGIGLIFLAHSFKARKEEALMTRQFGSEYDEYRKQTGALIPRL